MKLTSKEQSFIDYLNSQFPATIGHIPLAEKVHEIYEQAILDARKEIIDYEICSIDERPLDYLAEKFNAGIYRAEAAVLRLIK